MPQERLALEGKTPYDDENTESTCMERGGLGELGGEAFDGGIQRLDVETSWAVDAVVAPLLVFESSLHGGRNAYVTPSP